LTALRNRTRAIFASTFTVAALKHGRSKSMPQNLEGPSNKVDNPETHYDKPADIAADKNLSHDEISKALNNWEQDARQLLTASNEGMAGRAEGVEPRDHNRLGEVVRAKAEIGERPKQKPSH
jgi:hypothetical protein